MTNIRFSVKLFLEIFSKSSNVTIVCLLIKVWKVK